MSNFFVAPRPEHSCMDGIVPHYGPPKSSSVQTRQSSMRPLTSTTVASTSTATSAAPRYGDDGLVLPPDFAFTLGPDWLTSPFEICSDNSVVLEVMCCPYCQMGYMYHRTTKWYVDMDAIVCMATCCLDFVLMGSGYMGGSCWLRRRIQRRYGILEGGLTTCMLGTCCAPCSLCQVHREMIRRGEHPGGVCIQSPNLPPPPPMTTMGNYMPNGGASTNRYGCEGRARDYYATAASQPINTTTDNCANQQPPIGWEPSPVRIDTPAVRTPGVGNGSQNFASSYPTTPSDTKNDASRAESPACAIASPNAQRR